MRIRPRPDGRLGVLFLHTATQPPLGADTWVQAQIIAHLDQSAHAIYVACAAGQRGAPTPTYAVMSAIPGVTIVPSTLGPELSSGRAIGPVRLAWRTLPALASFARLVRLVRRERIAIVHTTDRPRDALAAVVLGRLTGARSVVHAHVGYDPSWMSRPLRWAIGRADHMIAISRYVASTLAQTGREASTIHTVLNGIDTGRWSPGVGRDATRRELDLDPSDIVVLTVCRLFPAKGVGMLVRALASRPPGGARMRLLVAGHEMQRGYRAELEHLAEELGVADEVTFLGRRDDVPALMAAADIYAMPSLYEPFGLVYAEAMAMELPVVALDNGGTPEVVEHGHSGLLSAPDDLDALVANLQRLADGADERHAMGRCGRQRVLAALTVERMAADAARAYSVIASGRPRSKSQGRDGTTW